MNFSGNITQKIFNRLHALYYYNFKNKIFSTTPKEKNTITSLWRLEKIILDTLDFNEVTKKIVNSILSELGYLQLGYKIIVLSLMDENDNILKRVSISETDEARKALESSPIPFNEINIPLKEEKNLCIEAFNTQKPVITHSMVDVLCPPLKPEDVIPIQKAIGIKTTMVYPILSKGKSLGTIIFSMSKTEDEISMQEKDLIAGFTDVVGLAVQNSQLYSSVEKTTLNLQRANERLKELDKLKDEFVSVTSHELRTPLTAIKSYLWMALNKAPEPLNPIVKNYLDIAYTSSDRLLHLVQDMLTVSRIEGNRLELKTAKINLFEDVAKPIYNELKIKAEEKNIKYIINKGDSDLEIIGDKDHLKEVMQNLVGNALKFTPSNGKITVSFSQNNGFVETSVSDTGPGISEIDIKKLFQKFQRISNEYTKNVEIAGTGLGLYISKQIISLHGGRIWVNSKVGEGSTFIFSLPKNAGQVDQQITA